MIKTNYLRSYNKEFNNDNVDPVSRIKMKNDPKATSLHDIEEYFIIHHSSDIGFQGSRISIGYKPKHYHHITTISYKTICFIFLHDTSFLIKDTIDLIPRIKIKS